jgi:hypothetical protein
MVSLSMIRAHGPGFTEIQDAPLTLTSGPFYFGKIPDIGASPKIKGHRLESCLQSAILVLALVPGLLPYTFTASFENIRASYELPI